LPQAQQWLNELFKKEWLHQKSPQGQLALEAEIRRAVKKITGW